MYTINKNAIVFHSNERMFKLVDAVEHYPDYLPWCGGSEIIRRDEATTIAKIEIKFKGIKQSFTTKNSKKYPHSMSIGLIDGPFKRLNGSWNFIEIEKNSCKVELNLNYEFKNILLEKLISPIFNMIANTFIDSFVKRAEEIKDA
jgi:ribosome-associated toxin RatA of RatAB toxin-antitoxin module